MLNKIFRNPIDVWPASVIVALFVALFAIYFYVENVWWMIAASVVLLPARLSIVAYNHNHIHSFTFVNPMLNRILEVMMFFQTGTTPVSGALNHVIGHHANYFKPEQDTLNWRRPDGSAMGAHEFSIRAALHHYPSCITLSRGKKTLRRTFLIYAAICAVLLAAVVIYDPLAATIVFLVPMLMMIYVLKYAAYAHHSGLPIGDDYTASRTNTGRFYNWLTWNAGYHAAHHFRQALHWSQLPAYHAELAARMPEELQGKGWGRQLADQRARARMRTA
ncbi:fatty acid desaturase [Tistrella mobilis]|uniref:fatty acid desaturase n=1 Tax=Tistrella mobilis TaxID=171437 RepID=UPI00355723E9